jgi:outer membrane murein-binding lipoprotein Lpp
MPENKLDWLPILVELGEEVVAQIIEKSPDFQSAILAAKEEADKAKSQADALLQSVDQ